MPGGKRGGAEQESRRADANRIPNLRDNRLEETAMPKIPVALQLYTVRDDLGRDFAGTIQKVAETGYRHVELAGYYGNSVADVKKILDANGITAIAGHTGFDAVKNSTKEIADEYHTLGAKYVVVPWIGDEWRRNADDYQRLGAALGELGAALKAEGLTLCYHNHAFEFEKFGGDTYGFDTLFAAAPAEALKVEMDTYWVKKGGEDPAAYLTRYAGRVPLVHLKDMTADGDFAPVGTGTIDYPALFAAAEAGGAEYYIVEQDRCTAQTPLESIAISFNNLKGWGKV
jgi:sugar phosphate isomerase/epimerase